ncbi:YbaN family protein [Vibrio mimicus]|uniref:YbaN family protein n=1 Tax=Vibrio mimicus TaxID=674 RepID=UPI002F943E70
MTLQKIKNYLLLCIGVSATAFGIVGVFVPLLPTVPFALLACYCFGASSPRFQTWLIANRYIGPTLRNIRENRGLTVSEKWRILLLVWSSILITVLLALEGRNITQGVLIVIAALETVIIVRYKTRVESCL